MLLLKYFILIIFIIIGVNTEFYDNDNDYLMLSIHMESLEKSIDLLQNRVDILSEKLKLKNIELEESPLKIDNKSVVLTDELKKAMKSEQSESLENFYNKTLFDIRTDKLPESCIEDPLPIDCKTATKCTQKSGYYKIFIKVNNEDKEILVFCDNKTAGGGWLSILRRKDGSINFTRPWSDYVNGFGNVESEYWLGLDNIHALTNNYKRQELYIYIENWEGESHFARYDNFVVGSASDEYQLKSLGTHKGTAGDTMWYNLADKFSTIDRDNDEWEGGSCAEEYESGWWFSRCAYTVPTGKYLGNSKIGEGLIWFVIGGIKYSPKIMNLMIREY